MAEDTGRLPDSGVTITPIAAPPPSARADSDATRSAEAGAGADAGAKASEPAKVEDVVQKRLNDTETALKERQAEFHKLTQALAELRGELKATQTMATSRQTPAEPESDWLDNEELDTLAATDTAKAVKQVARGLRGDVGKLLELRDKELRDAILKEIRNEVKVSVDPRRMEYREELSTLAGKYEWFNSLTPEHQYNIAEAMREQSGGKVRPPSTPGNGSLPAPTQTDEATRQAAALEAARAIFPTLRTADARPGVVAVRTARRGE